MKWSEILPKLVLSESKHNLLERGVSEAACDHSNHYRLQPFFLDNHRLIDFYSLYTNDDVEAKKLLDEVKDAEKKKKKKKKKN